MVTRIGIVSLLVFVNGCAHGYGGPLPSQEPAGADVAARHRIDYNMLAGSTRHGGDSVVPDSLDPVIRDVSGTAYEDAISARRLARAGGVLEWAGAIATISAIAVTASNCNADCSNIHAGSGAPLFFWGGLGAFATGLTMELIGNSNYGSAIDNYNLALRTKYPGLAAPTK